MSFLVLAEEGDAQKFPRVSESLLSRSTTDTHTLKETENRDANFDACLLLQAITERGEGAGSPMREVVGWQHTRGTSCSTQLILRGSTRESHEGLSGECWCWSEGKVDRGAPRLSQEQPQQTASAKRTGHEMDNLRNQKLRQRFLRCSGLDRKSYISLDSGMGIQSRKPSLNALTVSKPSNQPV